MGCSPPGSSVQRILFFFFFLSIVFSRQEHWSGLPFPSPGDLPNPGMEPGSPVLQVDSLPSEPPGKTLDCDSSRESSEKWIYLEIILYSQLIRLLECLRRCAGRKKGVKNFELTNQKVGVIINWCWKTTEDTRVLVNRKILHLSLQTLRDPWTVVHQAPLSMGFFRQEYWSALPFPSPGDLQPRDPTQVSCVSFIAGRFFTHWATEEPFPCLRL